MASIGDRIKERRLELAWTLDRLAAEAKVSKGFLSDLENGRRKTAGGDYLNELARALGVSLDFLVSGGQLTSRRKGACARFARGLRPAGRAFVFADDDAAAIAAADCRISQ